MSFCPYHSSAEASRLLPVSSSVPSTRLPKLPSLVQTPAGANSAADLLSFIFLLGPARLDPNPPPGINTGADVVKVADVNPGGTAVNGRSGGACGNFVGEVGLDWRPLKRGG